MVSNYNKPIIPMSLLIYLCSLSFLTVLTFSNSVTKSANINFVKLRVPTPPQTLEAIPNKNKVILIWYTPISDRGSEICEYIIYRKYCYSNYKEIGRSTSATLSFVDSNFINKIEYYCYTVRARNLIGFSGYSNEVIVYPLKDSSFTFNDIYKK